MIFSIFDENQYSAEVEYYILNSDASTFGFDFSGEGTGKHILTTTNWTVSTWYKMALGAKSDTSRTYFACWIKTAYTSGEWVLYGIISLGGANRTFNQSSVFMEDFGATNMLRGCRVKDSVGHVADSSWEYWDAGYIHSYHANTGWDNNQNCSYTIAQLPTSWPYNGVPYVEIFSGDGAGTASPSLPHQFDMNYMSAVTSSPQFPSYIQGLSSDLYVSPSNLSNVNSDVVQTNTRYWWMIESAGSGYVYILTTDRQRAITISGVNSGDDLKCNAFVGSDAQKWQLQLISEHTYYLVPKNATSMNMCVEQVSPALGAKIELYPHDPTVLRTKFKIY
jgi:hypothetical protein